MKGTSKKKGIFSFYSHNMNKTNRLMRAISITVVFMLRLKVLIINNSKYKHHKDQ